MCSSHIYLSDWFIKNAEPIAIVVKYHIIAFTLILDSPPLPPVNFLNLLVHIISTPDLLLHLKHVVHHCFKNILYSM